jgi:hypothetical protein
MHATQRASPESAPARILGFAGLFPFVGLAVLVGFGPDPWHADSLKALVCYGAVILTFVGALHWGYAVRRPAGESGIWLQYGFSVLPALAAWISSLMPDGAALRVQAVALLICYLFDRNAAHYDPVPEWFLKLRAVLTVVGSASLALASFS